MEVEGDEENAVILAVAIAVREGALILQQEEDEAMGIAIGRMGARIMGMMEDGDDLLDDDEMQWEKVEVDLDGYRRMGDPSFRRHFRLSKPTYEVLLETLANYLIDTGRIIRIRNALDIPLLMVLWILANPDTFRSVALRFGCHPSVVHFHYSYVIECLREMAPYYIQWPGELERNRIKARFEAYSGFPGIVGVVDGTHQNVTAPLLQKERYRNKNHTYSYNTVAICDDNLLITHLHVGEAGCMHDQRVFRRSPIYRRLLNDENGELLAADEHIIGDKAYALTDFVLTPFRRRGNLNPQQRRYNRSLSRSRVRIEHCFGKAFGQWRRMKHLYSVNQEIGVDHFTACYVLHNFMILNGERLLDLDDPTANFEEVEEEGNENDDIEQEDDDDNDEEEAGAEDGPNYRALFRAAKRRGQVKRNMLVGQFEEDEEEEG